MAKNARGKGGGENRTTYNRRKREGAKTRVFTWKSGEEERKCARSVEKGKRRQSPAKRIKHNGEEKKRKKRAIEVGSELREKEKNHRSLPLKGDEKQKFGREKRRRG